jgi:glycosyltransferase involved in cell wall biosynthesis
MKKILFVIPSLKAGGGEKSLINILNVIDYSNYKVDLLLFQENGIFIKLLPPEVNLIFIEGDYLEFSKPLYSSIFSLFKKRKFKLIINRVLFFYKNKIEKNTSKAEQNSWKNISKSISNLNKEYDVAIGFLEKSSIYYVVEKVKAKKKIGWVHTYYTNSGMQKDFDNLFYNKLNYLITVSETCKNDLQLNFPSFKDKIKLIYNIISPLLIYKLSNDTIDDNRFDSTIKSIVTTARLSKEKGIDLAIEASIELINLGLQFKWYIIGGGVEKKYLEKKIKEYSLESVFILLGLKENPYPFLKLANLYVQTSRYEGKSIAIDEAKILHKPIIVTNYSSAKDQINDGVNGIISEMDPKDIANKIFLLLNNQELNDKFILNLKKENLDTEEEIFKLYDLINE